MNLATNRLAIQNLGAASTVLASNADKVEHLAWTQCWEPYQAYLRERGVSEPELARMSAITPAALLNLPALSSTSSIA